MGGALRALSWWRRPAIAMVANVAVGVSFVGAAPISGFGELTFGMLPDDVAALAGCANHTDCLYDVLGKNRYVTLDYDAAAGGTAKPLPVTAGLRLARIDVDMGVYTREWFLELFDAMASQYTVSRRPTELEDTSFQQSMSPELVIGFADGGVLLKVVRRPFGNLIVRMVYQDAARARAQRRAWDAPPAP